jgi:protein dithiol oxidoreductase (disulfide-forming)
MLRTPAALFALVMATVVAFPSLAEPQSPQSSSSSQFEEGVHYERLPIPVETRNAQKVEVVEVFSYACIHCKNFQLELDEWRAGIPEHVDFQRMPATFNETWVALAQAFYTAEALGVTEQVHDPIFSAIHDRNQNLADPALMAEVFQTSAGIKPEQFNQVYRSFSVRSRVQQADARGRAYRLTGTPTLIVDGTFRVDARSAGGNAGMLAVVDHRGAERRAAAEAASVERDGAEVAQAR